MFALVDEDSNGFITADEIRKALDKLGDKYTEKDIEELIKGSDRDGDGQISYEGEDYM